MKIYPIAHKIPIKIVAVTGHTRSGKAIMLETLASFKSFEKVNMDPIIEEAGSLNFIGRLDKYSAKYLIRRSMLMNLYYNAIGRQINYRKKDVTSIYSYRDPKKYLKRSKLKEGDKTFASFIKSKPIYPLMIHDGLLFSNLLFESFSNIQIIHMKKSPIEIAYSWIKRKIGGGFEKNIRTSLLSLNYKNQKIPYYMKNKERIYLSLNKYDRAILVLESLEKIKKKQLSKLKLKNRKKILEISHSEFVTKTDLVLKDILFFLKSKKTKFTKKILNKNSCPRKINNDEYLHKKNFLQKKLSKKYYLKLLELEKNY